MRSSTDIRNKLIDQLMTIQDVDFLLALSNMINKAHVETDAVPLTDEQKIMLTMSDMDIAAGRTLLQEALHERELKWLNEQ